MSEKQALTWEYATILSRDVSRCLSAVSILVRPRSGPNLYLRLPDRRADGHLGLIALSQLESETAGLEITVCASAY